MEPEGSLPCSLVPILSEINLDHTTPSYFSKIHSNSIVPPTSRSSQWSLSFWVSHTNPIGNKAKRKGKAGDKLLWKEETRNYKWLRIVRSYTTNSWMTITEVEGNKTRLCFQFCSFQEGSDTDLVRLTRRQCYRPGLAKSSEHLSWVW
jgi:hypothetical protein